MDTMLTQRPTQVAGALDQLLPDGSIILYRAGTHDMFVLNPLAALIWDSSTGEQTIAAIIRDIRALFPDQESVASDVLDCVQDLMARGVIALPDASA
ncbi:MAG: PqqD family protein, partial [Thermomicrobia bacterium]|nr:PqqD family protein [Thermomicrobia bacterium]